MSATDELLPFIDNGGRRSYVSRRFRTSLFYVPDKRKSNKDRRRCDDRRKIMNKKCIKGSERRHYFIG
jgi:hypothetical protein